MREMKYSGIPSIGDVPSHWDISRIKTLLSLRSEKNSGDRELLSVYLDRGVISYNDSTGMQVHKPSADLSNYQNVHVGDFVLNNQQAWRGSVGVSKYDGIISPAYFVYDMCEQCYPPYMNFLLRDGSMVQQYETSSRGVGTIQRNLYATWFYDSLVVLPPMNEQIAIAAFLDAKCTEIDALIADVQAQIDVLEQYKRSVITETVTKGLNPEAEMKDSGIQWIGMMPSHWDCIRGKYILKYIQKPVREDDGVITCFRDGEVPLRSNRREDGFTMADKEIGYQGIDVGDLVVHGMDGFAGAIGISDSRGKASPVLNVLDTEQNKRYIMYFLRSMAYSDVFLALATGIRVRSCDLRWNKLAELFYPIPPIEEQNAIVAYIDSVLQKANDVIADKKEQLAVLESYKKSLIYEYVTGKKSVLLTEPAVEAVMIDPHVILAGMAIDLLGDKLKGKTQIQKLLYLFDSHLGLNLTTQYYRYNHGPYDLSLDHYLNILVENGWFKKIPGNAEKYEKGSNHAEFYAKYKDAFAQYSGEINRLISFVKNMKRTSQIERIATIFAVWNDLILDGNRNPTDDEIVHDILTHWTPNKANTAEDTWKSTLDKMRKQGIIPKGQGLHTLPMPQRGVNNA